MLTSRRKLYSQYFLHNRELVKKLVRTSSIGFHDLVLEVGPGQGIITSELLAKAKHVVAVEIDQFWYSFLQNKFENFQNLSLINQDILSVRLPNMPYKIFANIPFYLEGKLVRRLLQENDYLDDCYLIMRKELAYRLSGKYGNNLFFLLHASWFDFTIFHNFSRNDFLPKTKVHASMLRITRKKNPELPLAIKKMYQDYIFAGFGTGQAVISNLKSRFDKSLLKRIFALLNLPHSAKPTQLTHTHWLTLFKLLHPYIQKC